jgi:hypothetical protein
MVRRHDSSGPKSEEDGSQAIGQCSVRMGYGQFVSGERVRVRFSDGRELAVDILADWFPYRGQMGQVPSRPIPYTGNTLSSLRRIYLPGAATPKV